MSGQDAELDLFRNGVNCATLLERLPPAWRLDRAGSTRHALKYRRGEGEILIVNHDGRGWWDPQSSAKGDIFDLVQHLDPALNFGQVRQVLRRLRRARPRPSRKPCGRNSAPVPTGRCRERWNARPRLRQDSPAWHYLTEARRLPAGVLAAADDADIVREGPHGSAWFAHRDDAGEVSHIEIRGPDFKGSVRGGSKTLFRLPGEPAPDAPRRHRGADRRAQPGRVGGHSCRHGLRRHGRRHGAGHDRGDRAGARRDRLPPGRRAGQRDRRERRRRPLRGAPRRTRRRRGGRLRAAATGGRNGLERRHQIGERAYDTRSRLDLAVRPAAGSALARSAGLDRRRSGNRPVAHLSLGRLFGLGSAALRRPAQPHRAGIVPGGAGTEADGAEALRELLHVRSRR